jgi:hypothetical protein
MEVMVAAKLRRTDHYKASFDILPPGTRGIGNAVCMADEEASRHLVSP